MPPLMRGGPAPVASGSSLVSGNTDTVTCIPKGALTPVFRVDFNGFRWNLSYELLDLLPADANSKTPADLSSVASSFRDQVFEGIEGCTGAS